MAAIAAAAQQKYAQFSQEKVDAIVEAVAKVAVSAAETLARAAVEETGYGNVPDKILKNRVAAVDVPRAIRGMRTVGVVHEDKRRKFWKWPCPWALSARLFHAPIPRPRRFTRRLSLSSLAMRLS